MSRPGGQFSEAVEEALKEAWRLLDEAKHRAEVAESSLSACHADRIALKAMLAQCRKDAQNWRPALQSAEDECQQWKARCAELEALLKESDVELIGLGVKFAERNQALRDEVTQLKKALEGR